MLKATIEITGNEQGDIEIALEQVKRQIEQGFTSGFDSNDTGRYTFQIYGEAVEPWVWQFCLEGFDGDTDTTDRLVKLARANNVEDVRELVKILGWTISKVDQSDRIIKTDIEKTSRDVDFDLTEDDWRITQPAKFLVKHAETKGLEPEDFDEDVHDLHSKIGGCTGASQINNDGLESQIIFLMQGWTDPQEAVKGMMENMDNK